MKTVILPIAIFAWSLIPIPAAKSQDKNYPHGQPLQNSPQSKGSPAPPSVVIQKTYKSPPAEEKSQGKEGHSQKESHDWIDKLNAFSTGIIAIFTILLTIGVGIQISTARKTERAWIVVSPIEQAPSLGFTPEPNNIDFADGCNKRNIFFVSFKNTGETPAFLVESTVSYRYVVRLQEIPAEPEYGPLTSRNDMLLVKGDSIGEAVFLEPEPILTQIKAIAVRNREAFLYAYGVVRYRDAFKSTHETRFGFLYRFTLGGDPRPVGFVREELPRKYNQAT